MIRYEWRTDLDAADAAQLREVLLRAAAYDAEPEYNSIDPADVERDLAPGSGVRHLVIWLEARPRTLDGPDEPERVAGVVRLVDRGDGRADGTIVIDPDLRSIGIVTLLLEREGVDASGPDGWLGSGFAGIRSWARGNHPASGRIGDRNLLPRTRRVWKLVRPSVEVAAGDADRVVDLGSDDAAAIEELLASRVGHDRPALDAEDRSVVGVRGEAGLSGLVEIDLRPVYVEEFGRCASAALLAYSPSLTDAECRAVLTDLLVGAGARAAQSGLDGLIAYVSSDDDALVAVSRRVGLQHDRTDVLYEIR